MKKLFIMPLFVLFMTGSVSNGVQPKQSQEIKIENCNTSINDKVDSINIKAAELRDLIKKL